MVTLTIIGVRTLMGETLGIQQQLFNLFKDQDIKISLLLRKQDVKSYWNFCMICNN